MSLATSPELQDELYLDHVGEMVESSLGGYSDRLFYHVRAHGERVVNQALYNRQKLIENGIDRVPGLYVTVTSAAAHDRGYYDYFADESLGKQFPSAEDYAIQLIADQQRKREVDEDTIQEVSDMISATKIGVRCRTWGQWILCEADMHNTTLADRTAMKADTELLRREQEMLKGGTNGALFRLVSIGVLATYNVVNLGYSPANKIEEFAERKQQMRQNILAMGQDLHDETGQEIKDLIGNLSPPFLRPVLKLFGIQKEDFKAT